MRVLISVTLVLMAELSSVILESILPVIVPSYSLMAEVMAFL